MEYSINVYKSKEKRKEISINKIRSLGIDYLDTLPPTFSADEVKMKSIEDIASRYVANILSIQFAFDTLDNASIDESCLFFTDLLCKYGVYGQLNETEKKAFKKELSEKELINLTWEYEALNVLAWVLGLKEELEFPSDLCDVEPLIKNIIECLSFDEFINKCKLRDIEEILDELDLEYRYHWAIVNKSINESTNIGNLDGEVVVERRKALEWLFNEENDWNKISLDT